MADQDRMDYVFRAEKNQDRTDVETAPRERKTSRKDAAKSADEAPAKTTAKAASPKKES
jgi:hypothetical protein